MKKLLITLSLVLCVFLALAVSLPAQAAEFTNDGTIGADEIINDDLFISTGDVLVDGTVNGDLFINSNFAVINGTVNGNLIVNGARVDIKGVINGDVVFAGKSALIDGPVSGTLYAAGSSVNLGPNAVIGRNIFFAGYHLEVMKGARLGRDLRVNGYQVIMNGEVGRDVLVDLSALELGGKIERNVQAKVGDPAEGIFPFDAIPFFQYPGAPVTLLPGLRVHENAQIDGALNYSSTVEQANAIQARPGGGVQFTLIESAKPRQEAKMHPVEAFKLWVVGRLQLLITLLILAALAAWLLPGLLNKASQKAGAGPLRAAGWGLVTTIGGFMAVMAAGFAILIGGILVGVISLGGLARVVFGLGFSGLGLAFALFIFLLEYGSKLVVAHLVGKLLLAQLAPAYAEHRLWPQVLGILIYVPLSGIPLLGWLIGLLSTLLGIGAIWLLYQERRQLPAIPTQ